MLTSTSSSYHAMISFCLCTTLVVSFLAWLEVVVMQLTLIPSGDDEVKSAENCENVFLKFYVFWE